MSLKEITIEGIPTSPGIAAGKLYVRASKEQGMRGHSAEAIDPDEEINRFENGRKQIQQRWEQLQKGESLQEAKKLLGVQIQVLQDPELIKRVHDLIQEDNIAAETAIQRVFDYFIKRLSESENEKVKSQAVDLADTRNRLVEILNNQQIVRGEPAGSIVVAEELSPREVVELSRRKMKAFVTEKGAYTSHSAIVARSMEIPAITGAKNILQRISSHSKDATVLMNGQSGKVTINPSARTLFRVQNQHSGPDLTSQEGDDICKQPSVTSDGHPFVIRANLGLRDEIENIQRYHAEGIGLLRTESIFPGEKGTQSLNDQINLYQRIVQNTPRYPVSIRLFDRSGTGSSQNEGNRYGRSFLGWRGIRMLLSEPAILRTQLKAILTVASRNPGRIRIIIPMVSSYSEIIALKDELASCSQELAGEGIENREKIQLGMMVEIPGTALQMAAMMDEVDFLSVGTNDLTQYLLAVDRGNALVSDLYDQRHPAVWKVINFVLSQTESADMPVEVCGELASRPVAAACLAGMGISALSMSSTNIPRVKKILTEHSHKEMEKLAKDVLHCKQLEEIKTLFANFNSTNYKNRHDQPFANEY